MQHGGENQARATDAWELGQVSQAEHHLRVLLGVVLVLLSLARAAIYLYAFLCCSMYCAENVSLQHVCCFSTTKLVVQIGLYSIAFGFSWGPIGWLLPSEIHDLNTRSAGQSITVFTQLMSGAVVTQSNVTAHTQTQGLF